MYRATVMVEGVIGRPNVPELQLYFSANWGVELFERPLALTVSFLS